MNAARPKMRRWGPRHLVRGSRRKCAVWRHHGPRALRTLGVADGQLPCPGWRQLDREQDFLAAATMRRGEGHELSHRAFRGLSLLRGDLAQPLLAEVWEVTFDGGPWVYALWVAKASPIPLGSAVAVRQSGFASAWRQQCASGLLAEALWGASPSGASASRPASANPAKLCTRPDSRFGTSRARLSLTMRG